MLSQLAIFEFRMYFIPGAYFLLWVGAFSRLTLGQFPNQLFGVSGDITESLLFALLAYIAGHVLQTIAHGFKISKWRWGADEAMKKKYWGGYYPSEQILFSSAKLIEDHSRQKIVEELVKTGHVSKENAAVFEKDPTKEGRALSQALFYMVLSEHEDDQSSGVKTSEAYFYMLRGFFFASQLVCIMAIIISAYEIWSQWTLTETASKSLIIAAINFLLWRLFLYRCRGAAQGFVKKTFSSILKR